MTASRGVAYDCSVQVTNGGTEATRQGASSTGRPSVLIVEDDQQLRQMLLHYAVSMGCQVWEAANGLEALWAVKHHRPSLVLLDLAMPRLDGFETIRHLRKFDPSIRIVIITGDGGEATRRRVQELGLALVLKPFRLGELDPFFESR